MALTAQGGGASRYMSELVPALRKVAPEAELIVFVGSEAPPEFLADPRNDGVAWARLRVGTSHRMHVAAQMAWVPVLARRRGLDVLHSTANIGPLLTPGTARVVTLLDVIWLHQGERWEGGRAAAAFARLSRICARNADRLITISESARADIAASLGLGEDRLDVAPLGVRTEGFATPT